MKGFLNGKSLRKRVQDGDVIYGLIVKMPAPSIVEQCASAGFDLAVIDSEHGGADTIELEHHVRAAESFGMPVLVRVGSNSKAEVLRALDIGAEGLVVPHVKHREEAEAIIQYAHYPPVGQRGIATSTRAGMHGFRDTDAHLKISLENTLIVLQVEDREALDNIAEIASVPCVDVVFIGMADLSLSLGYPGQFDHPEVESAVTRIVNAVNESGTAMMGAFARDADDARRWKERGARVILFASTILFANTLKELARTLNLSKEV